jgi:hypothetical protein
MEVFISLSFVVWICVNMTGISDGLQFPMIVDSPNHLTGATIPKIVGKSTLNNFIAVEDCRFIDGQAEIVLQRYLGFPSQE